MYKLYPTIMDLLRCINSKVSPPANHLPVPDCSVQPGYPVPLTVTDISSSAGHNTDPVTAKKYALLPSIIFTHTTFY